MDAKTGTFKRYTTKEGLPDNFVVGIIEDSRGNLWISTRNGLCSFNPQTEVFHTYDMQDGLNTNDFKLECVFKARDGKMLFGGIKVLLYFIPIVYKAIPMYPLCISLALKYLIKR
jgi:ligand-binding sensor domain-containing protein